jgi:PilY1 beta-propeller domain
MKTATKTPKLKIAAILALGISALIFAAEVFDPTTQPPVTLGQYALKDRDLLLGNTKAYRPWFENGSWQGDIIEYDIQADGTMTTDAVVGSNPPSAPGSNWMARATFADAETADSGYWQTRNIITYNAGQKNFLWDKLSDSQKSALDPDTVAATVTNPSIATNSYGSDVLNYIRGDHSNERVNDGYFRTRYSLLGDITTSPIYIGRPQELLASISGYSDFVTANATRPGRIAAPANDGMLHILDETDGSEVFAYIPSMVIGNLSQLAARDKAYDHTYYLDGELIARSAQIGANWHTILTGGCGPGCAGLFALDMTDPDFTSNKILFEKTSSDGFGHIYGKPQIVPLGTDNSDPDWYIITGNGYSTSSGQPTTLKFISLDNFNTVYTVTVSGSTGGLSAPTLLSTDGDLIPDLAFAGDLNGNLWMFEINQSNLEASTVTKIFAGSPDQPITSAPAVAKHPTEGGYMVYFGTGSDFSLEDALNDGQTPGSNPPTYTKKQAVYGIWVDTSDLSALKTALNVNGPGYDINDLQTQTLVKTSKQFVTGGPTENVRIVPTEQPVNYRCPFPADSCDLHKGWMVELPNCGERLLATPFIRAGRVQFVTNNPTGLNCGTDTLPGDSWVMSLDYLTGGDGNNTVVYNLDDEDSVLDVNDTVPYTVSGTTVDKAPVGFGQGAGNIAQPSFARLRLGIDKMFINGIILPFEPNPPPDGPFLGGHIDVETDGPNSGLLKGGSVAPNAVNKHSEGYNVTTSDGLGGAVDGHVHAYDTIHGVYWVDLFQLEPRRGLANLEAVVSDAPCDTTTNNKQIPVGPGKCIDAVEGELNRVYDTLQTDANGVTETSMDSEIYAQGSSIPLDPDQKFIVVLANADRSNSGVLQIGCRTWPVVAYQDMITGQLETSPAPTPTALKDTQHGNASLVFTLAGIYNDTTYTCPSEVEAKAEGLSTTPTLRIGFSLGNQSIYKQGIHGTRAACVLGLHDYHDPVCYSDRATLSSAEAAVNAYHATPPTLTPADYTCSMSAVPDPNLDAPLAYVRDPAKNLHITRLPTTEGSGYRWRNGALTAQLLKVDNDTGNAAYELEPVDNGLTGKNNKIDYLPRDKKGNRIGGTVAKAFTVTAGSPRDIVTADSSTKSATFPESGLLYEATMFWHYSDLADELRRAPPASIPCYGDSSYSSAVVQEAGLNYGDYQALTKNILDLIDQYAAALQALQAAQDETARNQALLNLGQLLKDHPDLAQYDKYRDYAPGHIPEDKLLDIDKGQLDNSNDENSHNLDKSPNSAGDAGGNMGAKGPNYSYGRRNWVDIRQ